MAGVVLRIEGRVRVSVAVYSAQPVRPTLADGADDGTARFQELIEGLAAQESVEYGFVHRGQARQCAW